MTNLILAVCLLAPCSIPSSEFFHRHVSVADLPLTAPSGWKSDKQDDTLILTPPNVASGKAYAVTVNSVDAKSLSIDDLLEAGKKMVAEIGEYKVASEPKQFTSSGDWQCKFVIGGVVKGDRSLVIQVTAVKKDDKGGVLLTVADSVDTMTKFADDFTGMLRSIGGAKTPTPSLGSGKVDLQYSVPEGWSATKVNGYPLLVKEKHDGYDNWRVSLLIFPTDTQSGSIRDQFVSYWKAVITPNFETTIAPLPLMTRLKTGQACAFDGEFTIKDKNGNSTTAVLYLLVHGGRVTPIMGIYTGAEWAIDGKVEIEVAKFMDSARIPGTSDVKAKLFSANDVAGYWTESGAEHANYVTSSGAFVRSESIATASYFEMGADGRYTRTLIMVGSAGNGKEKDSGTWTVEDDELVLKNGGRYSLFGCGNDPKVGRFLVIGNNRNQKSRIKFTNPRGTLQATWLRAK